jgi:hypothetical protein
VTDAVQKELAGYPNSRVTLSGQTTFPELRPLETRFGDSAQSQNILQDTTALSSFSRLDLIFGDSCTN